MLGCLRNSQVSFFCWSLQTCNNDWIRLQLLKNWCPALNHVQMFKFCGQARCAYNRVKMINIIFAQKYVLTVMQREYSYSAWVRLTWTGGRTSGKHVLGWPSRKENHWGVEGTSSLESECVISIVPYKGRSPLFCSYVLSLISVTLEFSH